VSVNILVFIRVMFTVLTMRRRVSARRSSKEEASNYAALIKAFRASLSFLCLLGITWVFGALAIGKAAVVFIYLFAICNVLQGVVILIFHCYLDQRFGFPEIRLLIRIR
jgi:hypothetical protein